MTVPPFENPALRGRILLLEHASLYREVQQLLLRHAGYDVITADDTATALGHLELHRFDLILVDATHRDFVTAEFLTGARRPRPVSILAILWQPGNLSPEELVARGIDQVVETPRAASAIIHVVDEVLGFRMNPATPAEALPRIFRSDRVTIRNADADVAERPSASGAAFNGRKALAIDDACASK
jgi:response regulator RpfG family c-di-GMP phosphodiesterase